MINSSPAEYVFIRICILFLSAIAPISVAYIACHAVFYLTGTQFQLPRAILPIEIWFATETVFYFAVQVPILLCIQRDAEHPPLLSREQRRAIFKRIAEDVSEADLERQLQGWFRGAPLSDIGRKQVENWLAWAFFEGRIEDDSTELQEYTTRFEELLGQKFSHGPGRARPIRLTLDPILVSYRSLAWYMAVGFVDFLTYVHLRYLGFHHYRLPLKAFLSLFPFRPVALTARKRSPVKHLSYWLRPHTSKTRLPVLFVHGIGIGLYPYAKFFGDLNTQIDSPATSKERPDHDQDDGEIGILAIEIMPVSFRLTHTALSKTIMCAEIDEILRHHGYDKFVLVAHSYGSIIAAHMLHTSSIASKISSIVFVDPVCFLLHTPDVAYNFTVRLPKKANEWQLWYFASQDLGVAHTLGRRFFWSENVLWREEVEAMMKDRPELRITVSLAGRDLIVDTESVGRYLTTSRKTDQSASWKEEEWKGEGLEVIWNEDRDHAQVFDKGWMRDRLVRVVRTYTKC